LPEGSLHGSRADLFVHVEYTSHSKRAVFKKLSLRAEYYSVSFQSFPRSQNIPNIRIYFFKLSPRQAGLFLPYLLSLPFNILTSDVYRRAGSCDDDNISNEAPTLDGPTDDQSPGIGVEFETFQLRFESILIAKKIRDELKGKLSTIGKGAIGNLQPTLLVM